MSTGLSLSELRQGYADGHLDPVAVTEAYLGRIEQENPRLNAYVAVTAEAAHEAAAASAARWRAGRPASAIDGAPVDILFALLVPAESTQEHLDILASLATVLSDRDKLERLRDGATEQTVYQVLTGRTP